MDPQSSQPSVERSPKHHDTQLADVGVGHSHLHVDPFLFALDEEQSLLERSAARDNTTADIDECQIEDTAPSVFRHDREQSQEFLPEDLNLSEDESEYNNKDPRENMGSSREQIISSMMLSPSPSFAQEYLYRDTSRRLSASYSQSVRSKSEDPSDTHIEKREKQLAVGRQASGRYRRKQKQYLAQMESHIEYLTQDNILLQRKIRYLCQEISVLSAELFQIKKQDMSGELVTRDTVA